VENKPELPDQNNDKDSTSAPISILNLGFEQVYPDGKPLRWYTSKDGYEVITDQAEVFSGVRSLKMKFETFITQYDPAYLPIAQSSIDTIRVLIDQQDQSFYNPEIVPDYQTWISEITGIITYLNDNINNYLLHTDPKSVDWVIQDATIVLQSASQDLRDQYMADNVDWILDHSPPGSKIVLWAHNMHVSKYKQFMGDYLYQRHGDKMKIFGFCFHQGMYTARGDFGLDIFPANPSQVGSLEWAFHRTGYKRLMLDLAKVSFNDSASCWLGEPIEFRNIGTLAMDWAFLPLVMTDLYDALVFFDQTNPTVLLNVK
jgi:hypothetical protein